MNLGERIEKIMKDNDLNYRTLGLKIKYSDVQVRKIIKNESIPKIDFVQSLIRIFPSVSADWLLFGEEKAQGVLSFKNDNSDLKPNEIMTVIENLYLKEDQLSKYPMYAKWLEVKEKRARNAGYKECEEKHGAKKKTTV